MEQILLIYPMYAMHKIEYQTLISLKKKERKGQKFKNFKNI